MYDHMAASENLQFYGTLFGMSRSECADTAKLLLHRLELEDAMGNGSRLGRNTIDTANPELP